LATLVLEIMPDPSSAVEILSASVIFRSATRYEIEKLALHSVEEAYDAERVIIRQGDKADYVYFVLTGRVQILQTSAGAQAETVAELGPGELFGELGVLRNHPRSATVQAIEPTRCLKMTEEAFLAIVDSSTKISMALLRIITERST
jgi:CRP/FNR family cyclic AMP-dependent transcriptional regulator